MSGGQVVAINGIAREAQAPTEARPDASRRTHPSITPVSWEPRRDLGLPEWIEHGKRLGIMGRGCSWWIGDWLRYGNAKYGEKYSRAAKVTGYDSKSLRNMVYVASRFEMSRRRDNLSWSHHAVVAALAIAEQDRWLDVSEAEGLSVHCLKLELTSARNVARAQVEAMEASAAGGDEAVVATCNGDVEGTAEVACPSCGHTFDVGPLHPIHVRA